MTNAHSRRERRPDEPRGPSRPSSSRGFTLIEVMVTVAIFGILVAIASNSLSGTIVNMKRENAAVNLAGFLGRVRAEAVKGHARAQLDTSTKNRVEVLTCPARYGASACASSTSLTLVNDLFVQLTGDDREGVTLTPPATTLTFNARGFPETSTTYEFAISHRALPSVVRKVVVTAAGEVRIE